jgi:plastocyanin
VTIVDFAFEPVDLTVSPGTTVRWTNAGPTSHTATADDGSFDSAILAQGATFEHTFEAAGAFPYRCVIHPAMTGTITVQ